MDDIISDENLKDTFVYVDNVTVCGKNREEHDANLDRFLNIARKYNLTLNYDKCVFSAKSIDLLGYTMPMARSSPILNVCARSANYPHLMTCSHCVG